MFSIKLVLVAILIFLGCALAQSLQGEALGSELAGSSNFDEVVKQEGARWGRGGNNNNNKDDDEEENNNDVAFPPCVPPKGGRPVTAAPTQEATQKPTTRPTTAPTTRPSTAPTTRPTQKATQKPTEKATSAPTQKATQKPTSAPTQKATQKPSTAPTTRPTSAPATQKPTSAPTQKATQKPTSAPVTQKPSTGGSSSVGLCDIAPVSSEPLKMLLPLYNYPDSSWDQVVSAASKVDIVAIINPNSGPGGAPSSTYTTYMNKLNTAGVEQIGYVYTSYAGRAISAVKADIDTYVSKFPHVTGIFFDEASNKAADIPFYRELYNYVLAKGYKHSILNPGTSTDAGYVDISTTIVIYESAGNGLSAKTFPSYLKCSSSSSQKAGYKYKFSGMAHSASASTVAGHIEKFATAGMGMVFVTDGAEGCCTYNAMAGYFSAEITAIQSYNKK